jgi:hypothetical protein
MFLIGEDSVTGTAKQLSVNIPYTRLSYSIRAYSTGVNLSAPLDATYRLIFNSDTAANYKYTYIRNTGAETANNSATYVLCGYGDPDHGAYFSAELSNTATYYKRGIMTSVSVDEAGGNPINRQLTAFHWYSGSARITNITLYPNLNATDLSFDVDSYLKVYGAD